MDPKLEPVPHGLFHPAHLKIGTGLTDWNFPDRATAVLESEHPQKIGDELEDQLRKMKLRVTIEDLTGHNRTWHSIPKRVLWLGAGEKDLGFDRQRTYRKALVPTTLGTVAVFAFSTVAWAGLPISVASLTFGLSLAALFGPICAFFALMNLSTFESDLVVAMVEIHGPVPEGVVQDDYRGPIRVVVRSGHLVSKNAGGKGSGSGRYVQGVSASVSLSEVPRQMVDRVTMGSALRSAK